MIMITGKGDAIDRIVGLELGADDYIAKPFLMREVTARIRAVLRRYTAGAEPRCDARPRRRQRYGFDGWVVDLSRREALAPEGAVRELTTAEFNLLALFSRSRAACSRATSSWTCSRGTTGRRWTASIDALVARLRKKIEPDTSDRSWSRRCAAWATSLPAR